MRYFTVAAMALLLAGCGAKTEEAANLEAAANTADATANIGDTEGAGGDADAAFWTVNDGVDPMSDARTIVAQGTVAGDVNDIQVTVTCRPGQQTTDDTSSITYAIAGFDKKGEGARLDTDVNLSFGVYNTITYRADAAPAKRVVTLKPQYSNQAVIDDADGFAAAAANRLLLRVQFSSSNETYSLDQSTPDFRNAVGRCLDARAAAAQLAQRREAAAREAEAANAAAAPPPPEQPVPPGDNL